MDGRRRAREGWPSVHLSACSLITRYIYIYIFVRFVATDNRPRHRRPGNLNFGTGHMVLPRILSVYRFHTRVTSSPLHFTRFESSFCQPDSKEKNNIFLYFDTLIRYRLRIRVEFKCIWNINDYFFVCIIWNFGNFDQWKRFQQNRRLQLVFFVTRFGCTSGKKCRGRNAGLIG